MKKKRILKTKHLASPAQDNKTTAERVAEAESLWAEEQPESDCKSVKILKQLHDQGEEKHVAYRLGTAYYLGRGVERNLEIAYQYFCVPILDNDRTSLYYRGHILMNEDFSGFNLHSALKNFSAALSMGISKAQGYIEKISVLLQRENKDVPCTLCGQLIRKITVDGKCPHCHAAPRTRALPLVLKQLTDRLESLNKNKPLLGFSVTVVEEKILKNFFPLITSATLYGNYLSDCITGCDVRDLHRFSDNSFCGVFGILVFDYFEEHEQALRECARVTAPGGVFITYIARERLINDEMRATTQTIIKKTSTYFPYLPDDAKMPSIRVGRQTFINTMKDAGYHTEHLVIQDEASGAHTDWFVGFRI